MKITTYYQIVGFILIVLNAFWDNIGWIWFWCGVFVFSAVMREITDEVIDKLK